MKMKLINIAVSMLALSLFSCETKSEVQVQTEEQAKVAKVEAKTDTTVVTSVTEIINAGRAELTDRHSRELAAFEAEAIDLQKAADALIIKARESTAGKLQTEAEVSHYNSILIKAEELKEQARRIVTNVREKF